MLNKKIAAVSLGCAKNLVDTENMLGILQEKGFQLISDEGQADILMINTCGFIDQAKEESIEEIFNLAKYKEKNDVKLIVTGCLAQRYSKELMMEIPEIDALVGTGKINQIDEAIEETLKGKKVMLVDKPECLINTVLPRVITTPTHSAFVKIAEGCNNYCSYCAIPFIRGKYMSKPIDVIEKEVELLTQNGAKEIILVAQDLTKYGIDLQQQYLLSALIKKLININELKWLRLLYCYPETLSDEIIETISQQDKVCKYFDLPLQHISNKILKKMNRHCTKEQITNLIKKIKTIIPGVTLRTTFIVGFPGETEEDFEELIAFIKEVRFDRVGIFKYSLEEGTAAAKMVDQIPDKIKEERYQKAMALQQQISYANNKLKVGKKVQVIVEGEVSGGNGDYVGRTEGDAPEVDGLVYFKAGRMMYSGEIVTVEIIDAIEYDLIGVMK